MEPATTAPTAVSDRESAEREAGGVPALAAPIAPLIALRPVDWRRPPPENAMHLALLLACLPSLLPASAGTHLRPRVPLAPGPVLPHGPAAGAAHRLTVKFTDAVRARATEDGRLVSQAGASLVAAQELADLHHLAFSPLVHLPEATLRALEDRAARRTGHAQPDLAGLLVLGEPTADPAPLVLLGEALQALPEVEYAYLELLGPPPPGDIAPTTPDLTVHQTYVPPDPGLDAAYAHGRGFDGSGVRFSDCEYGWNPDHEDLNDIDLHLEPGQTIHPGVFSNGWDSHGTAVVGSASGVDNAYGVTGIAHRSAVYTFPEWTVEEGFRRVTCITNAIAASSFGDVVLLEMQTTGAGGGYGPAELDPNVFAVVKAGTDAGVVVVGAAGNGNQDLDSAAYASYRALGDSGAILVGAGSANTSHDKLGFSTFGARVNVQAWGQSVFTLGYGDFAAYGGDKNQRYTSRFNGTSSASGLAGPSACVLQEAAAAILGAPLSPLALRRLLVDTGIPQGAGGHIGPCIDLRAALERIDVMASAVLRNGSGVNPLVYTPTSLPVLATTWTAEVDAGAHAGAGATVLLGYSAPLPPTASVFGELLVDHTTALLFQSLAPSGGTVAHHALAVPGDVALVGARAYSQAVILGGYAELTNAVDLRLGY